MYPRSNQSFPIFSHICQNRRLLGSGNVRMLLNPKRLQQKVSMHFPTAQSVLNNISKIHKTLEFSILDLPLKSTSNYYMLPQNAVSRIMGFTRNSSLLVEV